SSDRSLERQCRGGSPGSEILDALSIRNHHFGHLGDVRRDGRGPHFRVPSIYRRCKGLHTYRTWNPAQVASAHLHSILRLPGARHTKTRRGDFVRGRVGSDRAHLLPHRLGLRRRHSADAVDEPRRGERPDIRLHLPRSFRCPDSGSTTRGLSRNGLHVAGWSHPRGPDRTAAFPREGCRGDCPSTLAHNDRLLAYSLGCVRTVPHIPVSLPLHRRSPLAPRTEIVVSVHLGPCLCVSSGEHRPARSIARSRIFKFRRHRVCRASLGNLVANSNRGVVRRRHPLHGPSRPTCLGVPHPLPASYPVPIPSEAPPSRPTPG